MSNGRRGFTLIEILIAVIILVIVSTTVARFAGQFSRSMADASMRTIGTGVATGRLELIRADPRYARLVTLYGSDAGADTTGFPNFPSMRRVTTLVRDQSGGRDRTTITVQVWDPAFSDTISVTALVSSPQ